MIDPHSANQYNHEFYSRYAESFAATRQAAWEGWSQLLPDLTAVFSTPDPEHVTSNESNEYNILDLGCGNARFLSFVAQHFPVLKCRYYGIDLSTELLALAQKTQLPSSYTANFKQTDLVSAVSMQKPTSIRENIYFSQSFHAICLFGVLHHIPEYDLRLKLLTTALSNLRPGGILVFTFWQFAQETSGVMQKARSLSHDREKPVKKDFSQHDYLLPWQGVTEQRFAHHFCAEEIQLLLEELLQQPAARDIDIEKEFSADGKNNSNHYVVLRREAKSG